MHDLTSPDDADTKNPNGKPWRTAVTPSRVDALPGCTYNALRRDFGS